MLVTNNAGDFRRLYGSQPLHAGLVIIIPNMNRLAQVRLFAGALAELAAIGDLVNRVLEVGIDGDDVTFALYQLPESISRAAKCLPRADRGRTVAVMPGYHPGQSSRVNRLGSWQRSPAGRYRSWSLSGIFGVCSRKQGQHRRHRCASTDDMLNWVTDAG